MSNEPFVLLSPKDSDAATMAAGSQVTTLPVANLQTMQPKKVWRSGGTTDFVTITYATAIAATMLALVGHNLSGAATIRVRAALLLANLTSAPDLDTTALSAWPASGKPSIGSWPNFISMLRWTPGAAYRFWRIDIADPTPVTTYIEAGRLMHGVAWQPTSHFDLDTGAVPVAFDVRDVQTTTPYGYTFTDRRAGSAARRVALKLTYGDQREVLDGIAEIQRLRGAWGDVACFLDPAATTDFHRYSMQGLFTAAPAFPLVPNFTANGVMYSATLPLLEIL